MSWTSSRFFHSSRNANVYEVVERSILGYYPHIVVVTNAEIGIEQFGEGKTRRLAFADLRRKIGLPRNRISKYLEESDEA